MVENDNDPNHKKLHIELHESLNELIDDYLFQSEKHLGNITVVDLLEWSYRQQIQPINRI